MWKSMQNGINFQYSTSAVAFGKSEKLIFAARNSIRVPGTSQNEHSKIQRIPRFFPSSKMLDYCIIYRLYGKEKTANKGAKTRAASTRQAAIIENICIGLCMYVCTHT